MSNDEIKKEINFIKKMLRKKTKKGWYFKLVTRVNKPGLPYKKEETKKIKK
jgi:hypothetical protein